MEHWKEYLGELLGTFILVLFGCSAVAAAVVFNAFGSLLEVAIIWGIGVTVAIFATRTICPAHLNPAVSLAMALVGNFDLKKLPAFILSQFIGAFLAGAMVYFIFGEAIQGFELSEGIVRGSLASERSAMIFGEFFPNPGFARFQSIEVGKAVFMEGLGTFLLVYVIFKLIEKREQVDNLVPVLIGATVALIICLVAPFTQAGLNPARDFGPRLVAYFNGWGEAAFPAAEWSFLTVYILGPFLGALAAVGLFRITGKFSN